MFCLLFVHLVYTWVLNAIETLLSNGGFGHDVVVVLS